MKYGYGVDIGGTAVKIALFDETGKQLAAWELPSERNRDGRPFLEKIARSVLADMASRGVSKDAVLGIGVGVPGPVVDGVVVGCDNLGWEETPVSAILEEFTGLPVRVGNDANLAALGESRKGGFRNMVLVTLGTGVGGGIVLNGKILEGVTGAAGEIGHMVLDRDETEVCGCGKRGCAEQYCSATGIVRLATEYLAKTGATSLLCRGEITCKAVFDAAQQGDEAAKAVLEQVYRYLAQLIANVCILLNPERVVIGGGVSKAGQPLLEGIKRYFDGFIYHASRNVELSLATLGNNAGAYGAFCLISDV